MSRETVARSSCHCCGGDVAVKTNVSGKTYYGCDHCGAKVQHTWQRTSDAYLAKIAPKAAPQPAPAKTNPPPPVPERRSAGTVLG